MSPTANSTLALGTTFASDGMRWTMGTASNRTRFSRNTTPVTAQDAGKFKDEIVPFSIAQKKGDPIVFAADEFLNRKSSAEGLAGLRPAFDKAGGVTAGNASGINDGAAAVLVMSAAKADQLGLKPLARIASYASSGLDPAYMGMGPVPASQRALQDTRLQIVGLGHIRPRFMQGECGYNADCGVSAACASSPPVNDAKDAVALMLFRSGGFYYICSGGLINDTDASNSLPLFLTAYHCISRDREALTLENFFQFAASSCGDTSLCDASYATFPSGSRPSSRS